MDRGEAGKLNMAEHGRGHKKTQSPESQRADDGGKKLKYLLKQLDSAMKNLRLRLLISQVEIVGNRETCWRRRNHRDSSGC